MSRMWWLLLSFILGGCGPTTDAPAGDDRLVIYSTTDSRIFLPMIEDFKRQYPGITVNYQELEAAPLMSRFLAEERAGTPRADLLLSTAMDLQVKLVNDGYAAPHHSVHARQTPTWARWRDEAFGFTFEPVVMVYNREVMRGRALPRTRAAVVAALRKDPAFWNGRIGTYDIVESSVGYLAASQDARRSSEFGPMVAEFREARMRQFGTTGQLLEALESGDLAMGYNLLGSYARSRPASGKLEIVYPQDYTLAIARTAVIPKSAPHSAPAHMFLEFLLSPRGQKTLTTQTRLRAVRPDIDSAHRARQAPEGSVGQLRPIPLGPGLLVYQDRLKRQHLLDLWSAPAPR